MWSLGCIAYELFVGYPLFAGENERIQFMCIMETIGPPPEKVAKACSWKDIFFDANLKPLEHANERGKVKIPGSKPISVLMDKATPEF